MTVVKNPHFWFPCSLFWINQYFERIEKIFIPFVHSYLDDLLAMPVVLGITLQIFRWIHSNKQYFLFSGTQILVGTSYIAFLFEILLPQWSDRYTADAWDIVCYGLGAVYFYFFINQNP